MDQNNTDNFTLPFSQTNLRSVSEVGGKNASLGEMISQLSLLGIKVPDGFAVTASAYRYFLLFNQLDEKLAGILGELDTQNLENLDDVAAQCRNLLKNAPVPKVWEQAILKEYRNFFGADAGEVSVAVRSSATAEDLPTASFAGQHDSFLNIQGEAALIRACLQCYISLFNDRAIKYRVDHGFDHMEVALSIGIQRMVRSDLGCAGVAFTLDPETGHNNIIYITGAWGLGENVVQGAVNPDEYYFFKNAIRQKNHSLIYRKMGSKENRMIYAKEQNPLKTTINIETPTALRDAWTLSDKEAMTLADWCLQIEDHYQMPMDIEWAKDGETKELFIVQARPETVHPKTKERTVREYQLLERPKPICTGKAVGRAIVSGKVKVLHSLADAAKLDKGDIIVADITNPDWNALLRKAVCIVTNKGGRTSHAAIVARELGIIALVGTENATDELKDGQVITVYCGEGDLGHAYKGKLVWEEKEIPLKSFPKTKTKPMFILADPDQALPLSQYPNQGVGLMRMEFIVANQIKVHPMALLKFKELAATEVGKEINALTRHYKDKKEYFVRNLAEALGFVAAAFYPKDVIIRMSDFKTNEYAQLLGGSGFEPKEENPMLGFRGASRYYNERYREAFGLECEAIKRVREKMGLSNVKVMIPFCRTVEEGKKVLEVMESFGLVRGEHGLEVYVMTEIPSNVILADQFAEIFDGFSIGSNDLTQLTLGIDRDSAIISDLFDENNEAVKTMLKMAIGSAKKGGRKIGFCGQAPSDFPEFSRFLVELGIDSISFTPDALIRGWENISLAENKVKTPEKGVVD